MLHCVALCCSSLQFFAVRCSAMPYLATVCILSIPGVAVCCSVLQCVAVLQCGVVMQCVAAIKLVHCNDRVLAQAHSLMRAPSRTHSLARSLARACTLSVSRYSFICKHSLDHTLAHTVSFHTFPRGGGLGSSTIFKKFHEPYAPS